MIAKRKEDRDILREGGRRLARHVQVLCDMVAPGVTSAMLEARAAEMVEKDGDKLAFEGYASGKKGEIFPGGLCVSINDVIVHSPAKTNNMTVQEGDLVCLDFGIIHKGLFTDHARTAIAGNSTDPHDEELLKGTQEALAAGIAQAQVGNFTGDIGYAVQEVAEKYGFGYPRNLSGHGVGKQIHEEPHVPNFGDPGKGYKLPEWIVIAIEPMMTLGTSDLFIDKDNFSYRTKDGSNSAHFEHTVLVTENGPEIVTRE